MNVFELFATLSLNKDEYEEGLNGAEKSASNIGAKISSGLGVLAKGTAKAIVATTTAVAGLVKASTSAYAEYEQLAGGAELLWGEAYDFVAEKAKNAYATVQMSQNDYLQQVNGFSTGLKESLGGNVEQASILADKIITAEADIVSATGVSQEAVQNAFNGIMKSNYTMLDNLQLGIKPTKEGMQEVIDKMNEWNKEQGRSTNYQMDNLADMQSALVDYVEYVGMAGYAQKEASGTIQGSLAMTKSAWQNFMTALADPEQSVADAIKNLSTSATALAKNVVPVVKEALKGISVAIEDLLPAVLDEIPKIIDDTLPEMIEAGVGVLQAIIDGIVDNIEPIIDVAFMLLEKVADVIIENAPVLIDALLKVINALVVKVVELLKNPESLSGLLEALLQITLAISKALIEMNVYILQALPDILKAVVNWILTDALPMIVMAVADLLTSLFGTADELTGGFFSNAIEKLKEFLKNPAYYIGLAIGELIGNIVLFFQNVVAKTVELFTVTLPAKWREFKEKVKQLPQQLADFFKSLPERFINIGKNIVQGLWSGISSGWQWLKDQVSSLVSGLVDGVKNTLGIHSPSKVFASIGSFMAEGLGEGWEETFKSVNQDILNALKFDAGSITFAGADDYNGVGRGSVYNQTINVNQQISSADELAQKIRIESRYGLMIGGLAVG